jgi:glutamate racemase
MRILFDHGTPSGIAKALVGHEVAEAIDRGWDRISNGELLTVAEAAGFEVLLTTDKNLRYQQNLATRKIAIVVLGCSTWRLVRPHLDRVSSAVNAATPRSYVEVDIPLPPKRTFESL